MSGYKGIVAAIARDLEKRLPGKVSCRVMLAGDRFYGTAELVGWC